jgi:hypothetical protein
MYWKNQITLAEAEIISGEHRRSVATQNCILAMERLIPFRRPTKVSRAPALVDQWCIT